MSTTRKMGKRTGYTETARGEIIVAPMHADAFSEIMDDEVAIQATLDAVTRSCTALMKGVARRQRLWWVNVRSDLGLKADVNYNYQPENLMITEKKEESTP